MRKHNRESNVKPEPEAADPSVHSADAVEAETPAPPTPGGPATPASESAEVYRDRWLRTEADLQNFRRRSQRDVEEAARASEERVMLEMISMLDDLERALEVAREADAPDPWLQGVQLVANRMNDSLARQGVTPMRPIGQPFDPRFHEALLEIEAPADTAPGSVVQVVRQGYQRGNRALRPARVVVAKRSEEGQE